jgi:hypothetical protein
MHLFVIPNWLNTAVFVGLAVFTLWKGGSRERVIAVAVAVEAIVSVYIFPAGPDRPMWRTPVYDGVILAICIACVVRADRYWTIWASSFALAGEASDLTIFAPGISLWATFSASLFWTYAIEAAVLWGVLAHRGVGKAGPTARLPDASRRARP